MRPIKLEMQAFGAYAGRQEIDFRRLGGRNFFLIHGPTGSGKTTILDAICFALYGATSGGERKDEQMRSDHADSRTPTEVVFEFSLGPRAWRIVRRPEQTLRKQRGEGMTTKSQSAELHELIDETGAGTPECEESRAGTPVPLLKESRWSQVNAAVAELLGFQCDQFRQVVVIPQGRFRELLTSPTRERQEILRVLFQTWQYQALQEELLKERNALREQLDEARGRTRHILDEAGAASAAALEARREELAGEIEHLGRRLEELERARAERQRELDAGRAAAARLAELDTARSALEALECEAEAFNQKQRELERARAALPLAEGEAALKQCAEDERKAKTQCEQAGTALDAAQQGRAAAEAALARERERESERTRAQEEVLRLRGLAGKVEALEAERKALETAARELKKQSAEIEQKKRAREELAKLAQGLRARREAALGRAAEASALAAEAARLGEVLNQKKRLEAVERELNAATKAAEQRQRDEATCQRELAAARAELEQAEENWLRGQAAILARRLSEGAPCPVCGSANHPAPAQAHGALPEEAQIRSLREAAAAAQQRQDGAAKKGGEAKLKLAEAETKRGEIAGALGGHRETPAAELEAALKARRTALAEAEAARDGLGGIEQQLGEVEKKSRELEEQLARLDEALCAAIGVEARARAAVESGEREVPEALRGRAALEQALGRAAEQQRKLAEALEAAQRREREAAEALARCEAELRGAAERHDELERRAARQQNEFDVKLRLAGFERHADYAAALRDGAQIVALERAIRKHREDLAAARARHAAAVAAAEGLTPPDIAGLEGAVAAVNAELSAVSGRRGALESEAAQAGRWLAGLGEAAKELEKLDGEYRAIGKLAEIAGGTGPFNPHNLSFERFIQGVWLDRVLARASLRLSRMSRERFVIKRLLDPAHGRAAGGLDLQIHDNYTGTDRPVATLSGGESFMASLALALGLADVVQARTGGIWLETIFVDEGFGSLDPEALDLALETLIDLQQGGRLVGIISHVPELKERIDVRLEVEADKTGSRARFVV